jgi:hypothetical protein
MGSHHVVYQLILFALIWLVIILHLIWSKPGVSAPVTPAEPEPLKPKRPRSNALKPFEGLTQKPHCALCERDALHPKAPPCGTARPHALDEPAPPSDRHRHALLSPCRL